MNSSFQSSERSTPSRVSLAWTVLALTIVLAVLLPVAFPVLILLPPLSVALVVPHPRRRLFVVAWVASWVVVVVARWQMPPPYPTPSWLLVGTLMALVTVALALLWQWGRRTLSLANTRTTLHRVEQQVEERTLALQKLLEDIERRAEKQERLLREVQQRTRDLTLLNEIGEVFRSAHTLTDAHEQIAQRVQQLFAAEAGAFYVRDTDGEGFHAVATWGDARVEPRCTEGDCWALRQKRDYLVLLREPDHPALCRHLIHDGATEYFCVPLRAAGHAFGLLHLRGETLSEDVMSRARLAAEQTALVLWNLSLQQHLSSQSVRDPLTGLYHARYLQESLRRELRRLSRSQQPLGLILLDVDHFRTFIDLVGHHEGDSLLRQLGDLLQISIRGGDVAARSHDDAFGLMLPGAPPDVAIARAEQVRQSVQTLPVQQQVVPGERVTLSIGIACFPQDGTSDRSLLQAAEEALARAQAAGGNRVELASPVEG